MRTRPLALLLALLLFLAAVPAVATASTADLLALVPADAAAVGAIQLADLRSNPLSARLFSDLDRTTVDGDAARFLEETKLNPREDVDRVVVAAAPGGTVHDGSGLVLFEGRFDVERIAAALVLRGAKRVTTPDGDYFLLPKHDGGEKGDGHGHAHKGGTVAVASSKLVIAGSEASVRKALADRKGGGAGFASSPLGKQMGRIGKNAAVWALVDTARVPGREPKKAPSEAAAGLVATMRSVTLLVFQAVPKGDGLALTATGLSPVAENRDNLEDALRGVLAVWRMAEQEKNPEMVAVLRTFKVEKDKEGVTVSGTLPGAVLKAMAEKKKARTDQK